MSSPEQARTVVDTAALIVEHHQALEHDGVLIDAQTANAICTVHRALSERNRLAFEQMDPVRAGRLAWRLIARYRQQ